jgi:hypothetical protein
MKSYLVLDQIVSSLGVSIIDPNEGANDENHELLFDLSSCIEGMANRIERFQLQDIDSCLHMAVLEFIYASQHKKHKAAEEIAIVGAYSTMNTGEMVDLAELSLLELYNRITADMVAPCIVRSCELLADVIHTNYLITQWHRSPFDPRNNDPAFLHCNAVDDDEESVVFGSGSTNMETMISNAVSNAIGIDTLNMKEMSQNDLLLSKLNRQLIQGRTVLWDELQKALVEMLRCINISAAVTADDIYAISWSINAMVKLGKDFCGANCQSLSDCMKDKLKEYFNKLHIESFHMVRQIISAESWQNVPIHLDEMGGVFGIIKKNFSVRNSDNTSRIRNTMVGIQIKSVDALVSLANDDIEIETGSVRKGQSLLGMFGAYGNPLHFMTDGDGNEILDRTVSIDNDNPTSFVQLLTEVDKERCPKDGVPSVIIVTQSCMNGLARYAGRYLEIMHEIPSVAPEAFTGLCQLFDYYLCAIFHGFVPLGERMRFTTKGSKMTILAANQSKDFEALQSYLDRTMNDVVPTGQMIRDDSSLKSNSLDAMNTNYSQQTSVLIPETVKLSSLLQVPAILDFDDGQSYYALTERVMAAESCWFAVNILNEVKPLVVKLLPGEESQLNCSNYISQYQLVANQLRGLVYKSMCPQLIKQQQILQQLVENSWDSRKKVENEHHEWVDSLISTCGEVWKYISEQKEDVFQMVQEQIWLEIYQAAFDTALDGFCKIRKCSAEGRAAMTIDVAALHDGLNSIHRCNTLRGKLHIENLIKASYMAEDDMMEWVAENWQSYSYKQLHGLLSQTLSSVLNSKRLKDAVAVIDTYYECENNKEGGSKLSNLLSKINREEAGSKISSVLSSIRSKSLPFNNV